MLYIKQIWKFQSVPVAAAYLNAVDKGGPLSAVSVCLCVCVYERTSMAKCVCVKICSCVDV